jgi:hypothetical protein
MGLFYPSPASHAGLQMQLPPHILYVNPKGLLAGTRSLCANNSLLPLNDLIVKDFCPGKEVAQALIRSVFP